MITITISIQDSGKAVGIDIGSEHKMSTGMERNVSNELLEVLKTEIPEVAKKLKGSKDTDHLSCTE